jgi:hypothetical protein
MAAKIPQDVTREDRLFGPFTLRQFLAVLLGAGVMFICYEGYAGGYLYFYEFIFLASLVGTFTAAWTFAKVNGRPFPIFLINLVHFIGVPKRWGWAKEDQAHYAPMKVSGEDIKDTKTEAQERKSGKVITMQIEQLASVLDTGGTISPGHDDAVITQVANSLPTVVSANTEPTDVEDVLANTE